MSHVANPAKQLVWYTYGCHTKKLYDFVTVTALVTAAFLSSSLTRLCILLLV